MVTQAWQQSDSPRAFVRALEAMGYVLATGKRPYVLVDMYGEMNALPKMIDDRSVRTKDIRAFLEREFPPDALPTVEEARALVATHRKAREQFAKAQQDERALKMLEASQTLRRDKLIAEQAALRDQQRQERAALSRAQLEDRRALKADYLSRMRAIKTERARYRPTGLAAFLGRVSGVSFILHKLYRHRDAQKFKAYVSDRANLTLAQKAAGEILQRRHELQSLDMGRRFNALGKVEARERQALSVKSLREQRVAQRAGHDHMPALVLDLKPKGRGVAVRRAKDRYRDRSAAADEARMREAIRREDARVSPEADLRKAPTRRRSRGISRGRAPSICPVISRRRRGTALVTESVMAMMVCPRRASRARSARANGIRHAGAAVMMISSASARSAEVPRRRYEARRQIRYLRSPFVGPRQCEQRQVLPVLVREIAEEAREVVAFLDDDMDDGALALQVALGHDEA